MNIGWIIASLAIGAVLGAFYFGGLWLTVREVHAAGRPALLLIGSFLLRAGVVLVAFYFVANGRWERFAALIAGFLLARTLLVRKLRLDKTDATTLASPAAV
jgi:F1F0 ATPase subunit 2